MRRMVKLVRFPWEIGYANRKELQVEAGDNEDEMYIWLTVQACFHLAAADISHAPKAVGPHVSLAYNDRELRVSDRFDRQSAQAVK